jgi:predicted ribosome quality control (RQC) complex YloA/Tae2 family protein
MPIRWDPLLAREAARELDERLRGARLRALRFDGRTRDALLLFRNATVVWRLHPTRGYPQLLDKIEPDPGDLRVRARVRRVHAPADERIIVFELVGERTGASGYELAIELLGNRLNAILTEGPERIARHVLRTREGKRPTRVGQPWRPPPPTDRAGADGDLDADRWVERIEPVPPPDRARELVRTTAWVSPLNVSAFLGEDLGPDEASLREGHARWRSAVLAESAAPVLLQAGHGLQPYPWPLAGTPSRPVASLIEAFAACAEQASEQGGAEVALGVSPALLERVERAVAHAERRVVRLRAELDGQPDPDVLRGLGDLLLARYGEIPRGASTATVKDFTGVDVELSLDPALPPHENASAYYDRAARAERAVERLPRMIERAAKERDEMRSLLEEARAGTVDPDRLAARLPTTTRTSRRGDEAAPPPYRRYRSSGGLEIRVGRGAKQNDELTFRHSAPNDVWMHARHTAGAHVILRWPGPGNPPARDLQEAGTLAALHSKARTSSSVPVDWTLRKHVRKPRGSAPGSVVPDRVSTIFVRPDEAMLDRLSEGSEGPDG